MRIPSVASREFWRAYRQLPRDVRKAATQAYRLWQQDAFHPSLHFKKVGAFWSARVGIHFRALSVKDNQGDLVWFWIGNHADYDRLIS